MFRISPLAYVALGCVGFAAATIAFVLGDAKNVIPLIVLGGVALAAALIKAARSRDEGRQRPSLRGGSKGVMRPS